MRTRSIKKNVSKTALAELERFLASTEGAMLMPEAHGFLTALASAPSMIMPSTWQREVIGESEFDSMAQAQSVVGALMGLWYSILESLNKGRSVEPPGAPDPEMISRWCAGYLKGTRLDEVWRTDERGIQELLPIAVLAGEFDLEGNEDDKGEIITDAEPHRERYRARLGKFVLGIHQYWTAWRRENLVPAAERAAAPSRTQRIGRNEKCPCGSGLKYKRCCGATRVN